VVPLEPWEKVFIKLVGRQKSYADIDEVHSIIGCVNCHGGKEPAEFADAHGSNFGFVRDPSRNAEEACNPCHAAIVATNSNSMHSKAWGERTSIAQRELGIDKNHTNFDECPIELTEGLDRECSSCHTTCGQCHVSRPASVENGFIQSHKFKKTPDQTNNCLACHGSRIAIDFEGHLEGNQPDIHHLKYMKCWNCHKEDMHADASNFESRYHLPDLPQCEDCHSDSERSNSYHRVHWPEAGKGLACYVCHSQPYNNCNSCHTKNPNSNNANWWRNGYGEVAGQTNVHSGGGGYLEYPDFKIGYNYNQDLHDGEFIVVRHIPITRDSYEPWGHIQLAKYDERPTWEYSSPHNIQKFTAQTDTSGGGSCSKNCHLVGDNASENQDRYLWQRDLEMDYPDEIIANMPVIVDDKVPDYWQKP